MKWMAGTVCGGIVALALVAHARAELLYEFTFHGTVTTVEGENPDHAWGDVELGDPAYFRYVIDVTQEDQVAVPDFGRYSLDSVEVSFADIPVTPGVIGPLEVDTFNPMGADIVDIVTREVWTDDFNEAAIFRIAGFGVLPDDSIPIEIPLLDFGLARSVGYGDGVSLALRATFDSYTYRTIPAPSVALCIAVGAVFQGCRRRKPAA